MKKAFDSNAELQEIRKISANKKCFDCNQAGTTYAAPELGIFLCSICGGIHREFSHRVKGLSTCNFSEAEVTKLKNLGNERAALSWMAKHDSRTNPIPDVKDSKKLKEFLRLKYTEKKFYENREAPQTAARENSEKKVEEKKIESKGSGLINLLDDEPKAEIKPKEIGVDFFGVNPSNGNPAFNAFPAFPSQTNPALPSQPTGALVSPPQNPPQGNFALFPQNGISPPQPGFSMFPQPGSFPANSPFAAFPQVNSTNPPVQQAFPAFPQVPSQVVQPSFAAFPQVANPSLLQAPPGQTFHSNPGQNNLLFADLAFGTPSGTVHPSQVSQNPPSMISHSNTYTTSLAQKQQFDPFEFNSSNLPAQNKPGNPVSSSAQSTNDPFSGFNPFGSFTPNNPPLAQNPIIQNPYSSQPVPPNNHSKPEFNFFESSQPRPNPTGLNPSFANPPVPSFDQFKPQQAMPKTSNPSSSPHDPFASIMEDQVSRGFSQNNNPYSNPGQNTLVNKYNATVETYQRTYGMPFPYSFHEWKNMNPPAPAPAAEIKHRENPFDLYG